MVPGLMELFDAPIWDAAHWATSARDALSLPEGWQLVAQAATEGETATDGATVALEAGKEADFSVWAIVERADIVVKSVIGILVLASLWSWAIIFDKMMLVRRMNRRADRFEDRFWSGGSVDDLYDAIADRPRDPLSAMFVAAMREWRRSHPAVSGTGGRTLGERIERVMHVVLGREMDRMERFTGFLATVASTAPFVGLFGTVWGIMNSFQEIAIQKNTNLTTVAPGISEALFATALGLVAAIPATVAYNKFSVDFDRFAHRLESFSTEFGAIISRQLDDRGD